MIDRRHFLKASVATLYMLCTNLEAFASDTPEVFPQGIASGDPTQNSIVLWTRINPEVHKRMQKDLLLEISTFPDFSSSTSMRIPADRIVEKGDFTISLTLDGIRPGTAYYYRFIYADVPSLVGRFKTLPEGRLDEIKIAYVVCQNYADGYYSAFKHLSQEDVQFVVHLGDQIYEKIYGPPRVPGRDISLPSGGNIAMNLEDYRHLYKVYLSDKNYQLCRAMQTFVYIWDDHEFVNDYSYNYEGRFYNIPGHPFSQDRERSLMLRRAATKAWLEFSPVRVKLQMDSSDPLKWITIYRDFKVEDLVHLICLDERSYREKQPCGKRYASPGCPQQNITSMLGREQKRWFLDKLEEGSYRWKVVANEVQFVMGRVNGLFGSLDAWDGYAGERREIIKFLTNKNIDNLVFLTGDRHAVLLAEIPSEFKEDYSKVLGVEFMTPALSSVNAAEMGWWKEYNVQGVDDFARQERMQNPWIKYINHRVWGYSLLTLGEREATVEIISVDKYKKEAEKRLAVKAIYRRGEGLEIMS